MAIDLSPIPYVIETNGAASVAPDGAIPIALYGSSAAPANATTTTAGVVKQSATQADSVAADAAALVTDFNALLAKLKAAGIMA